MNPLMMNIGRVLGGKAIGMIVAFFATVITVRVVTLEYGATTYGAVSLVATLSSLVPIADLGLGIVLTNLMVRARMTSSTAKLRRSLSTISWLLLVVAALITGIGVVLGIAGLWSSALGPAAALLGDPNEYMPWYTVLASVWIATGTGYRLLAGQQRNGLLIFLQTLAPVLSALATLILTQFAPDPLILAFVPLAATILTGSIALFFGLAYFGGFSGRLISPRRLGARAFRDVLSAGLGGLLFSAGTLAMFAFDRVILSRQGGATDLAVYAAFFPLFAAAQGVLGSVGTFLWPHYTRLRFNGALGGRLIAKHTMAFVFGGIIVGATVTFASPLYAAAIGHSAPPSIFAIGLGVLAFVQCSLLPLSSGLTETWQIRSQGVALVLAFLLKIVVSLSLVSSLGASSVVYASAIAIVAIQLPSLMVLFWLTRRGTVSY